MYGTKLICVLCPVIDVSLIVHLSMPVCLSAFMFYVFIFTCLLFANKECERDIQLYSPSSSTGQYREAETRSRY